MATNHYRDPLTSGGVHGTTRNAGGASSDVQQSVINEIINQARNTYHLGDQDVANLLAIAKLESGFNPDAAAKSIIRDGASSDKETSASGVFQVTDSTAADALKRLSNTKTDNNVTLGTYNRFDYKSNIQYGISIYLDKKRVAKSDDVFNIYKAWNTNPNEYNRYQTSLRNDESTYAQQISTSSAKPGAAEPSDTDTLNCDKVYVYAPQGYLTLTQELQLQPNIMDPAVQEAISYDHFSQELLNTTRVVQNSDGTSSIEYTGTGGILNFNNASITMDPHSDATIGGINDKLLLLDSDVGTVTGSGFNIRVTGDDSGLILKGSGSVAVVFGNNDGVSDYENYGSVTNYGSNDVTANYGDHAQTFDDGSDEHNFNYGPDEWAYSANSTDTNYNEYASDRGAGYGSYGYGGWGSGGGYHYGYYGYAGAVESPGSVNGNEKPNIDALIAFDKAHGNFAEANAASQAMSQINLAIDNHSESVSSGATWKHQTLTWNFSSDGSSMAALNSNEEQMIQAAFDEWSAATGLKFKKVSESAPSDINFKWSDLDTQDSGLVGLTTIKRSPTTISHASIELEKSDAMPLTTTTNGVQVYAGSGASFEQVLLHEIGHAIGLGDNIDPSSIECYNLTQSNGTLNASDIAMAASLYDKASKHVPAVQSISHNADDLIQAMSSFAPVRMVNVVASNDVNHVARSMYGMPMKYAAV